MKLNPILIVLLIGMISVGSIDVNVRTTISYLANLGIYALGGNPGPHQRSVTNVECDDDGRCFVVQPAE